MCVIQTSSGHKMSIWKTRDLYTVSCFSLTFLFSFWFVRKFRKGVCDGRPIPGFSNAQTKFFCRTTLFGLWSSFRKHNGQSIFIVRPPPRRVNIASRSRNPRDHFTSFFHNAVLDRFASVCTGRPLSIANSKVFENFGQKIKLSFASGDPQHTQKTKGDYF